MVILNEKEKILRVSREGKKRNAESNARSQESVK